MSARIQIAVGLLMAAALSCVAQFQPWAVQWCQHASTAKNGRDYLGMYGTNIGSWATGPLLSPPAWKDQITTGSGLGPGGSAPGMVPAGPAHAGFTIYGMGFNVGEDAHASCQLNHDLASTNTAFPQFYIQPHIHISARSLTAANKCAFRMVYEWANISSNYATISGVVSNTNTFSAVYEHQIMPFPNVTNNSASGSISTVFRFMIERINSGASDMTGTRPVIVDSVDVHYPVGRSGSRLPSGD